MGKTVNLDRAKAARAEALGEAPVVVFGGEDFTMPAEMPFEIVELIGRLNEVQGDASKAGEAAGLVSDIAKSLFGDRYREFLGLRPSLEDVQFLLEGVAPAYGLELGESEASES